MLHLGFVACAASLLVTGVGMPSQIRRNHRSRSAHGLCPWMLLLLQGSYGAWAAYGWSIRNSFIVASSLPAFALGLVLLYQWWRYHPSRPSP